jgi:hypothetical protein
MDTRGRMNESKDNNSINSTIKSSMMKRVLFLIVAIFMVFAGAQSLPTTQANAALVNAPCEMSCTQFIDPNDGQCKIICCPVNENCKQPCEMTLCKN